VSGLRQLHTAWYEYTLSCLTCQTLEHLGYEKPDVPLLMATHRNHQVTLDARAITYTSASKEDLEMLRCMGCSECDAGRSGHAQSCTDWDCLECEIVEGEQK
jgi:hypothetical protein